MLATRELAMREESGLASRWGWVVARGVIAILFGLLSFALPGTMGLGLLMLFAAYAFVGGIAGAASVAFGLLALYRPVAGGVALVTVLGAYALAFGVLMIVLGFRLRTFSQHLHEGGRGFPTGAATAMG